MHYAYLTTVHVSTGVSRFVEYRLINPHSLQQLLKVCQHQLIVNFRNLLVLLNFTICKQAPKKCYKVHLLQNFYSW